MKLSGDFAEESIIFRDVLKWFLLASGVGALTGLVTALFIKLLVWSSGEARLFSCYFFFLPPALFVSAMLIRRYACDTRLHRIEIEAVRRHSGKIAPSVVLGQIAATLVTIVAGGSVGKEAPCAQIGAGISSALSGMIRLDEHDRKKLAICGIAAGLASVLGTPIGGALYGVEFLYVGALQYEVLLPALIAAVTSYKISSSMGVTFFYSPITMVPVFSEGFLIKVAVAGVCWGLISFIFVKLLSLGKRFAEAIPISFPWKALIGGGILVLLACIFSTRYLGLGLDSIEEAYRGDQVPCFAWLLKCVFTVITFSFWGTGGIVTPLFFIGASSGSLLAGIMGLDRGTFAAIGSTALLAGAANTPVAASVLAIELFGPEIAPYAAVACIISFLMTGQRSVFPFQEFAINKAGASEGSGCEAGEPSRASGRNDSSHGEEHV